MISMPSDQQVAAEHVGDLVMAISAVTNIDTMNHARGAWGSYPRAPVFDVRAALRRSA